MLRQFFRSTACPSYLSARTLHSSVVRRQKEGGDALSASEEVPLVSEVAPTEEIASDSLAGSIQAAPAATASLDDILGATLPGMEAPSLFSHTKFRPKIITSKEAHKLHIRSSRNNTILTLTNHLGEPLASASGGSVGFKKSARSGYEAGYRAAFSMFGQINENKDKWRVNSLELLWNGFGQGREAVYRALLAGEGEGARSMCSKMIDKTPVKIGGVRPKKRRIL